MDVHLSDQHISGKFPCDICGKRSRHWLGWQAWPTVPVVFTALSEENALRPLPPKNYRNFRSEDVC
jgi:hypothetical protein